MEAIEGVLLTGGASRRMGRDKASIPIDGLPLAERVGRELALVCARVSVLGPEPVAGWPFFPDPTPGAGPVAALAAFEPSCPFVFVASCDLPRFRASLVEALAGEIGPADACLPEVGGRIQPLCGLYRREAFTVLRGLAAAGESRVMAWVRALGAAVYGGDLAGLAANVNTPEDLSRALDQ